MLNLWPIRLCDLPRQDKLPTPSVNASDANQKMPVDDDSSASSSSESSSSESSSSSSNESETKAGRPKRKSRPLTKAMRKKAMKKKPRAKKAQKKTAMKKVPKVKILKPKKLKKPRGDQGNDLMWLWTNGHIPKYKPYKPQANSESQMDTPLVPGPHFLADLFRRFISRCSHAQRDDLEAWLRYECDASVASLCSGTGCDLIVWHGLSEAALVEFGITIHVRHIFSSENITEKQSFLEVMHPGDAPVFECVHELASAVDVGHMAMDAKSRRLVDVPKGAKHMSAGFPCQDASQLSKDSGTCANRLCLSTGEMRTGSVFCSSLRVLHEHCPEIESIGMENVWGLTIPPKDKNTKTIVGPDNCTSAMWRLENSSMDICTVCFELSPEMFGVPQHRRRVYFCGIAGQKPAKLDQIERSDRLSWNDARALMKSIADKIVGSQMISIDDYLVPDDDELVVQIGEEARARAAKRAGEEQHMIHVTLLMSH